MASLAFPETALELGLPFSGWPIILRCACVVAIPILLVCVLLTLSRYERRLVPRRIAAILIALCCAVLLAILGTLLFDPQITKVRREEVPGRVLIAIDTSGSMRVDDPQRSAEEKIALAKLLGWNTQQRDEATRLAIAERCLQPDGLGLIQQLKSEYAVEIVGWNHLPEKLGEAEWLVGTLPLIQPEGRPFDGEL